MLVSKINRPEGYAELIGLWAVDIGKRSRGAAIGLLFYDHRTFVRNSEGVVDSLPLVTNLDREVGHSTCAFI